MSKALSSLLQVMLFALGFTLANSKISLSQVTSDNTVNTQVNQNGNVAEITGGETRGDNLFHSFQDFSVSTGNEAFFNNANDLGNIFSRVTGGNISNIDGMIRANGSANLFLINPAGIMFGANASLNIGGSFYGSSASSILFEDGEFSATDLDTPPVLTVNAPIGLGFRDNPGDISANQATLLVNSGQTLALVGGNLNFDGTILGTFGGKVELGGVTESGEVAINNDGSLSFPEAVARGNVSFASARVAVAGDDGSSININAKNLSLTSGSQFFAGINSDSGSADAQAGDVVFNLTEDLTIDNSSIINSIFSETGNLGDIKVNARNISFSNGGNLTSFNNGQGDSSDIIVTATGDITFDGIGSNFFSGISNSFADEAQGSVGEINITAQNLSLTNGGDIFSLVRNDNDSGDINLNIADTILIDGFGTFTTEDGTEIESSSNISSSVSDGNTNSGNININSQNLVLNNDGSIRSSNFGNGNSGNINIITQNLVLNDGSISSLNAGQGDAGDINFDVGSLSITEGGIIGGSVRGEGNGANIVINADNNISIVTIVNNSEFLSAIRANVESDGTGEAGNIEINTPLLVLDEGSIAADVEGQGNGGTIKINTASLIVDDGYISTDVLGNAEGNGGTIEILASESIKLSNDGFIQADVLGGGLGNGGNLTIETKQLTLSNGSQISATTLGDGNAGTVTINADESINLSGTSELSRSGIFASAFIGSGKGGDINLTTDQLTISDGATIAASNFSSIEVENGGSAPGTGEPGNISITANSVSLSGEGRIETVTQAKTGTGAEINLQVADNIFLSGDSFVSAAAIGDANGGNLTIDTNFIIAFEGNNDIIASAEQGIGGNIDITAESLLGIKASTLNPFTNDINASSQFGLDGSISLNVPDVNSIQGETELSTNVIEPGETTAQVCGANREIAATNSLVIKGKGGVPAAPEMPMDSGNIIISGEIEAPDSASTVPEPIATSIGDIQPARGIKVTEQGEVILTAYPTNNQGDRLPLTATSCG